MSINTEEVLASLRLLGSVAMADGQLHENEEAALAVALEDKTLNGSITLESLVTDDLAIADLLAQINSPTAQELAYNTAFTMANIDGDCSPSEQEILDQIQTTFDIPTKKVNLLSALVHQIAKILPIEQEGKIEDAGQRQTKITEIITSHAVLIALFRAFPNLGAALATDILICTYQCQMIREIGKCWGHEQADSRSILGNILTKSGLPDVGISLHRLVKLEPIWGSAVGIPIAFSTTWAIGKLTSDYFAAGGNFADHDLAAKFQQAKIEGEQAYRDHTQDIRDRLAILEAAKSSSSQSTGRSPSMA
jgi:uncharacterized protein (DUF697 family)/uncharacterized tellurite resistance protein B-like protein